MGLDECAYACESYEYIFRVYSTFILLTVYLSSISFKSRDGHMLFMHQSVMIRIIIISDTFHFSTPLFRSISFHTLYLSLFFCLSLIVFRLFFIKTIHLIVDISHEYGNTFQWVTNWLLCNVILFNPHTYTHSHTYTDTTLERTACISFALALSIVYINRKFK